MLRFSSKRFQNPNQKQQQVTKKIFSFSGSGWMMIFHLGAVRALQERPELLRDSIFCGASGGALAAVVAGLNVNTEVLKDHIIHKSETARKNKIDHFRLRPLVVEGIDLVLQEVGFIKKNQNDDEKKKEEEELAKLSPQKQFEREQEQKALEKRQWQEQIQPQIQNRCQVFILGLPEFSTIIEETFETKRTFVEALVASACIPPFAGMPFRNEKGQLVVDGGLLKMVPRAEEKGVISVSFTNLIPQKVTISPASGRHVKSGGRRAVPIRWALFPPNAKRMEAVYWAGYREMSAYLEQDPEISKLYPRSSTSTTKAEEKINQNDKSSSTTHISEEEEMVRRVPQYNTYLFKLIMLNVALAGASMYKYFPRDLF